MSWRADEPYNALPLLPPDTEQVEARDSSEIENIVTTTDRLFRHAEHEHGADPATREALRYRTALQQGFRKLSAVPLSTRTAVEVCSTMPAAELGAVSPQP